MKSYIANLPESVRNAFKLNQVATYDLPLFPLGSVFFPGGAMALKIFEQRYLDMAKICLKTDVPFGIALIREGNEVGTPAVPETVGTLAYVTHWDMQNLGILQVRVKGASRFKLLARSISKNGLIVGQVSTLPDDVHSDCEELFACAEFLRKILLFEQCKPGCRARRHGSNWVQHYRSCHAHQYYPNAFSPPF